MTTLATSAGFWAVGFALVVVLLYTVACARGCLPWRIGIHVLALGVVLTVHIVLSTVTLVGVPEVREAQPWRAPLLAALHAALALSLAALFLTVRDRVTSNCKLGHTDRWHRPRHRRELEHDGEA